jgi:hypothetical protein
MGSPGMASWTTIEKAGKMKEIEGRDRCLTKLTNIHNTFHSIPLKHPNFVYFDLREIMQISWIQLNLH